MTGITAYGAYIPRLRLQRKAIAQANAWFAPNLMGAAKGERAMANFDEDAVTMAVEAGRDCLPAADPVKDRAFVDAVTFASTTMPFSDRQNAGIVAAALNLSDEISSIDVSSSQRAGTSAVIAALDAVKAGRAKAPLVVAGENRKTRAASSQEMAYGDAGAALTFGNDKVIAKFLGSHSLTRGFRRSFSRRERGIRLRLGRTLDPRRGLYENRARRDQIAARKNQNRARRYRASDFAVSVCETGSGARQEMRHRSGEIARQSGEQCGRHGLARMRC